MDRAIMNVMPFEPSAAYQCPFPPSSTRHCTASCASALPVAAAAATTAARIRFFALMA